MNSLVFPTAWHKSCKEIPVSKQSYDENEKHQHHTVMRYVSSCNASGGQEKKPWNWSKVGYMLCL